MAKAKTDIPIEDPTALAKFGKLEVVARLVVEGYLMGQHKSPYKGSSIEFVQHRHYYPGDEIRHIDWRAFGKTGKYYIKEYEDETNLRCYLLIDGSGSMGYARSTISKFDYARYLGTALGYLLLQQRDATGLITFDTEVRERSEPSSNPQNFQKLVNTLERFKTGGETSLGGVFEQLLPTIKRRSLVVILSDCFDEMKPLMTAMKRLRHARNEVLLFHIVAPEEEDFPFSKPTQFRNIENTAHRKLVDPHSLRKSYIERYESFCAELQRRCNGMGVDYQKIVTVEPYQKALGAFLDMRTRKKSKR